MLVPGIFCVVAAVVALLFYVVYTMKPKRLKLNAAFWRVVFFNFEADSGVEPPKELPPGEADP